VEGGFARGRCMGAMRRRRCIGPLRRALVSFDGVSSNRMPAIGHRGIPHRKCKIGGPPGVHTGGAVLVVAPGRCTPGGRVLDQQPQRPTRTMLFGGPIPVANRVIKQRPNRDFHNVICQRHFAPSRQNILSPAKRSISIGCFPGLRIFRPLWANFVTHITL
jgi:hypothetical protein